MRKAGLLREVQRNRMLETAGINAVAGVNLISVDIQPEYEQAFDFKLWEFLAFVNNNIEQMNSMTFLYNGADTIGMIELHEYQMWLVENGLEEENLNYCRFYDKGYAFFRYCMDEGIDDDDIVKFVKFMVKNDINDSRDIDEANWQEFMTWAQVDESEIRDLLENASDMINIPDLMDFLENYGGRISICGGGINECMKEVEIALQAMEKPYQVLTAYTY